MVSRLQAVSERLALFGAYSQQFTNKNLDASEKFSLGGPNAVRAYPQGEGAGDQGYFANLEMRYRLPLEDSLPGTVVLTGFYDFGRAILINRPTAADFAANTARLRRVAGPGVGINWEVPNDWYLRTTMAFRDTTKATADHMLRYPLFYFHFSKLFGFAICCRAIRAEARHNIASTGPRLIRRAPNARGHHHVQARHHESRLPSGLERTAPHLGRRR